MYSNTFTGEEVLTATEIAQVYACLPLSMRQRLNLTDISWDWDSLARVYPLLTLLTDHAIVTSIGDKLRECFPPAKAVQGDALTQALDLVNRLGASQMPLCQPNQLYKYRLPVFLSEFPVHSRKINQAIGRFNQLIETYYTEPGAANLDGEALDCAYQEILHSLKHHYTGCDLQSLWQLLSTMSSWLNNPTELYAQYPLLLTFATCALTTESQPCEESTASIEIAEPIDLAQRATDVPTLSSETIADTPLRTSFDYGINRAGRLANESYYVLLNAFGMKPGGHVDALAKQSMDFLPWEQLSTTLLRQLSHYVNLASIEQPSQWLMYILANLGVKFYPDRTQTTWLVAPFLAAETAACMLSAEKVLAVLQEMKPIFSPALATADLKIIANNLRDLLQSLQANPGIALGIGANWDGTVSLSNEAGTYAFQFSQTDTRWGRRFKQISVHRQGPSEAYMNAGKGIRYELGALATNFEYMSQLQPSEYAETLYNALVDNLITDLFPEPPYFQNKAYRKYRKHHVVKENDNGLTFIDSFYQPADSGTYFRSKEGNTPKQTPMYRAPGSMEVKPFPRDIASGKSSKSYFMDNPLGPLHMQYAQSKQSVTRGHIVYNPTGPDTFIADTFYGQVILTENGDFIPFIGIVPKNFDKHLGQDQELCGSFVVRMLHSSRLREYCPTFSACYQAIKDRFLPFREKSPPPLPSHLATHLYIRNKWQDLESTLHQSNRHFADCERLFFSLFKNLVYSLYSLAKDDLNFHQYFIRLISHDALLSTPSRMTCESLIRDLITNQPQADNLPIEALQAYAATLHYLQELLQFFYPSPTESIAKAIASQARLHLPNILRLPQIKAYFADLPKQIKLSRKQTPGMLLAALKDLGPSQSVHNDYFVKMHGESFPSGYRSPEGFYLGEPETGEKRIDKAAKTVGAFLQLIYRTRLANAVVSPIAFAYSGYQQHKMEPAHHVAAASMKGFAKGLVQGTATTISAPFRAVRDVLKNTPTKKRHDHALAISAAPKNEANLWVQANMEVRDYFLNLLAHQLQQNSNTHEVTTNDASQWETIKHSVKQVVINAKQFISNDRAGIDTQQAIELQTALLNDAPSNTDAAAHINIAHTSTTETQSARMTPVVPNCDEVMAKIIELALSYFKRIYPRLLKGTEQERDYRGLLAAAFPLQEAVSWQAFFEPIIPIQDPVRDGIVAQYALQINSDLIDAVYTCVTHKNFIKNTEQVIKDSKEKYKLRTKQAKALDAFTLYFKEIDDPRVKENFLQQFAFKGIIHQNLQARDNKLRLIDDWLTSALNETWIRQALLPVLQERYTQQLANREIISPNELSKIVAMLPLPLQFHLGNLLNAEHLGSLEKLRIDPNSKVFLTHLFNSYQSLSEENKQSLLAQCKPSLAIDESALSLRDKEQQKWREFVQKEWHHQLLPLEKAYEIIAKINHQGLLSLQQIMPFQAAYRSLLQNMLTPENVAHFFVMANLIKPRLDLESQKLLQTFTDVTMKTVMNQLLDSAQSNAFISASSLTNPLLDYPEVGAWLTYVQEDNSALRHLLRQQKEQTPTLNEALQRCDYILEAIEFNSKQSRIPKTGLQKLLFATCQHSKEVGPTDYRHEALMLSRPRSKTMRQVFDRVKTKLGPTNAQHALLFLTRQSLSTDCAAASTEFTAL